MLVSKYIANQINNEKMNFLSHFYKMTWKLFYMNHSCRLPMSGTPVELMTRAASGLSTKS